MGDRRIFLGARLACTDFRVDLSASEDFELVSKSEDGDTASAGSMTSLEDLSAFNPPLLLYKAARARNLRVMLEAIALGASVNWVNERDAGKTPLIQAIRSVSEADYPQLFFCYLILDIKTVTYTGDIY